MYFSRRMYNMLGVCTCLGLRPSRAPSVLCRKRGWFVHDCIYSYVSASYGRAYNLPRRRTTLNATLSSPDHTPLLQASTIVLLSSRTLTGIDLCEVSAYHHPSWLPSVICVRGGWRHVSTVAVTLPPAALEPRISVSMLVCARREVLHDLVYVRAVARHPAGCAVSLCG